MAQPLSPRSNLCSRTPLRHPKSGGGVEPQENRDVAVNIATVPNAPTPNRHTGRPTHTNGDLILTLRLRQGSPLWRKEALG